jgi:hypothetical protein
MQFEDSDLPDYDSYTDPMYDFYRVKENFREILRKIEAEDIAGCFITRGKVFWIKDADDEAKALGQDWIVTNRVFWPLFEYGRLTTREELFRQVSASCLPKPSNDEVDHQPDLLVA